MADKHEVKKITKMQVPGVGFACDSCSHTGVNYSYLEMIYPIICQLKPAFGVLCHLGMIHVESKDRS